jgi:MFS transporter, ACS family, solute carrier family 17 (sodium-dependent inorganic phosphate cotransporter), other
MSITLFFSSYFADWLQEKKILTTTQVRRYFNCTSFAIAAIFLLLCVFVIHKIYTVALLTIGVAALALSLSGFAVNHLDIAPKYASILFGISNFFASVPGIVSPILTGYIVTTSVRNFECRRRFRYQDHFD